MCAQVSGQEFVRCVGFSAFLVIINCCKIGKNNSI
jgi:hypothetical protein